ncbi:hypothetical protein N5079_18640 [Planotetraspora sp. A-T 1434]|uniref:hypothetical protein n=1 Tax=Planotetraspora sp. A-T 1434 TaxID=2979219 RepID=UPI0021BF3447|nr:hypothetical protein [Planotetraspora sp. A-T 1434]MCT9932223.1 hypothetical protein [Planotetraspora sp. A-T 1434]
MKETGPPTKPGRFEGEDQHGYSPDVERGSEEAVQAGDRAFSPEAAGAPDRGREESEEERSGVSATDTEARSPQDVGKSASRQGEEIAGQEQEPGREPAGATGKARRPTGTSTTEDSTGVGKQEPIDEESPTLPAGDQGG